MTRYVVWGAIAGLFLAAVLFILNILNVNNLIVATLIMAVIGAILGLIAYKMTSK
jgi:uncharacterized membrane protein YeaQ/YmgE (transglycosylase-associated protein family)